MSKASHTGASRPRSSARIEQRFPKQLPRAASLPAASSERKRGASNEDRAPKGTTAREALLAAMVAAGLPRSVAERKYLPQVDAAARWRVRDRQSRVRVVMREALSEAFDLSVSR